MPSLPQEKQNLAEPQCQIIQSKASTHVSPSLFLTADIFTSKATEENKWPATQCPAPEMVFRCTSWSCTGTPRRRGRELPGFKARVKCQVSRFRTYQRAGGPAAALGAMSTSVRLLQTQLYKMHFYRQENNLNTGAAHSTKTGLRLTLAGTAMRTKGSSKNTGKERKTSQ